MKKILVTGAAGTIGVLVLEKLLEADKYEITALDLKSNKSIRRLKKFVNKINIVYGDITDSRLMNALIRDHDNVIHLAGIIPPFADIKSNLAKLVDYEGTKVIINAINDFNPSCFLLFASSTSLYGENLDQKLVTIRKKIEVDPNDYYRMAKLRCEEKIRENVKNYTIFRLPAVLGNLKNDSVIYNIPKFSKIEFIVAGDAANAFVYAIEKKVKINKKIFNIAGGENCRTTYRDFMNNIFKFYGLSFRYIATSLLVDKNFYSAHYGDSDDANKILGFRTTGLDAYFKEVKKMGQSIKRFIPIILAKPFIKRLNSSKRR